MVYFCADDYGVSKTGNHCIETCLHEGAINKVSVLPNGEFMNIPLLLADNAQALSLHVNLVEGRPLSDPAEIPLLVTTDGYFRYSFLGLLKLSMSPKRKEVQKQLYIELQKQVRFWKQQIGEKTPMSIDSHQHVNAIPLIFKTLLQVIRDEQACVEHLRIPAEPLEPYLLTPSLYLSYPITGIMKQWLLNFLTFFNRRAFKKMNIRTTCFMGAMFSGRLTVDKIKKLRKRYLAVAEKRGQDIEIALHPGYITEDEQFLDGGRADFRKFYSSVWRKSEHDTLMRFQQGRREGHDMYIDSERVDERTQERLEELSKENHKGFWIKKRLFDIFFATLILLGFLPLMIIIAIVICIDDPSAGPFFKQKRVGRHGHEFYMYKFRTMRPNAEAMLEQLRDKNEMEGPVFKIKDDPRVTRVGKILRKLSLDELMQFFNVFKGDMTLVGPRPPLPGEVEHYTDYQKLRLIVTPGLTCTWQIHKNRNDVPFEEWVEMDLRYIESRTFPGDLWIMLKTPIVMLSATGR